MITDKKEKHRTEDFAVPVNHRVKIKERNEYMVLDTKIKQIWNMKATVIPIVISALGTLPTGWLSGVEELEIVNTENSTGV